MIDLTDLGNYSSGFPHDLFTALRRERPVFLHEPEPSRFDVRRDPNPHLAFGHGTHFCLFVTCR